MGLHIIDVFLIYVYNLLIDTWACIGREGGSLFRWLGHWRHNYKLVIIFTIAINVNISQAAIFKAFPIQMPPG